MARFPKDATKDIQAKKTKFYLELDLFFRKYHPEQRARFTFGDGASLDDKTDAKEENLLNQSQWLSVSVDMRFALPIQKMNDVCWYYNSPHFNNTAIMQVNQADVTRYSRWQFGHNYDDWMNGYFVRNKCHWTAYQKTAQQFEYTLMHSTQLEEAKQNQTPLKTKIAEIKAQIQAEMPAWRFQWSFMFIKTAGWPFNQKATRFAEQLLRELDHVKMRIDPAIVNMQRRLTQPVSPLKALSRSSSRIDSVPRSEFEKNPSEMIDAKIIESQHKINNLQLISGKCDAILIELDKKIRAFSVNHRLGFTAFKNIEDVSSIIETFMQYKQSIEHDEYCSFVPCCENLIKKLQPFMHDHLVSNEADKQQFTLVENLLQLITKNSLSEESKRSFLTEATKILDETNKINASVARNAHGFSKQSSTPIKQSLLTNNKPKSTFTP